MSTNTSRSALEEAVKVAGSVSALAAAIGKTDTAVHYWRKRGWASADSIVMIERATGVPREALRPDLFRREPSSAIRRRRHPQPVDKSGDNP